MEKMERRSHMFTMQLTSEEHDLLRDRAKEENMSIAQYLRYCLMLEAVYAGKPKVFKILAKGFSQKFVEWFNMKFKVFTGDEELKPKRG
jgi:Mobilization protein NikA